MKWVSTHPLRASFFLLLIIFLLGALLTWDKFQTTTLTENTWSGFGGTNLSSDRFGSIRTPEELTEQELVALLEEGEQVSFASLTPTRTLFKSTSASTNSTPLEFGMGELETFFSTLNADIRIPAAESFFEDSENSSSLSFADIYAFVPATIAQAKPQQSKMTLPQRELYSFGNEAGSFIETYSDAWGDQAQILQRFINDRGDAQKQARVRALSSSLARLGTNIESISYVPTNAQSARRKLSTGYKELGALLRKVGDARTDEELLSAMIEYNARADSFVEDYISVVTLFSVAEIKFSQSDPGRVFTFTPTPTL